MDKKLVSNAETQHRALKLRIYPNQEQEILINKTFGCCRKVYNNRIAEKQAFYENVIKPETDPEKRAQLSGRESGSLFSVIAVVFSLWFSETRLETI